MPAELVIKILAKSIRLLAILGEHETVKYVKVDRHVSLSICKWLFQICVVVFTLVHQLWYAKGYQNFSPVKATFTTKVKGLGYSNSLPKRQSHELFEKPDQSSDRIWDNVDYVVSSATDQFFVMTNAVLTPNQIRKRCPEDYNEIPSLTCGPEFSISNTVKQRYASRPMLEFRSKLLVSNNNTNRHHSYQSPSVNWGVEWKRVCKKGRIKNSRSHGKETGKCVRGDRSDHDPKYACEIRSWCPVEYDTLQSPDLPLIYGTENFTVLIKNTISFPLFGDAQYRRNNMPNGFCTFEPEVESTWLCPIFRLGDIVKMARGMVSTRGNYQKLALKGGVIGISVVWNCDLDWNFMKFCLPKYHFFVLDDSGSNFRYGKYHEENRRTLTKAYGIKFIITASGTGGKFDLTNLIIILGNCFGLIGFANIAYDFIILRGSSNLRKQIIDRKYVTVDESDQVNRLRHSMMAIAALGELPDQYGTKVDNYECLTEKVVNRRNESIDVAKRREKSTTLCSLNESHGGIERLI